MNTLDIILVLSQKYQKFIVSFFVLLVAISLLDKVLAVAVMVFVFLCAATLLVIRRQREDARHLSYLFVIVFLLHSVIVVFLHYTGFQPFSGGDYTFYDNIAREVAERVRHYDFSLGWVDTGNFYPVIVGYLYLLTVSSMLIGQLLNAWMVAAAVIFLYLIVLEMGSSKKAGFFTGMIAALYPSLAFFGSLLLKDALVILLSLLGLFLVIKLIKRFSWKIFLIFYLALILLTNVRFYASFALMLTFIICWLLFSDIRIKKRMLYGFFMILLLGFIPKITGHGYLGKDIIVELLNPAKIIFYREKVYAPPIQTSKTDGSVDLRPGPIAAYTKPQPVMETKAATPKIDTSQRGAGSSFVIKTGIENPITFVKNTFLSFLYVFLGPFPWQIKHVRQIFILPEVFAWYFLLFFIGRGIVLNIRDKYKMMMPIIIFSVIMLGVIAVYSGNFGIAVRIRMPACIALLCFFTFGFKKIEDIKIPWIKNV